MLVRQGSVGCEHRLQKTTTASRVALKSDSGTLLTADIPDWTRGSGRTRPPTSERYPEVIDAVLAPNGFTGRYHRSRADFTVSLTP